MRATRSLLILCAIAVCGYGIYSALLRSKFHEASERSAKIARDRFMNATINDTIYRIDEVYGNSCHFEFWIKNYSMGYVVVDACKYPILKQVDTGTKIIKNARSNECSFIKNNKDKMSLRLVIEY
jgi:hypothetical protein